MATLVGAKAFGYDFTNKEIALINLNFNADDGIRAIVNSSSPTFLTSSKGEAKFRFICYYSVESHMKQKGVNAFPFQCFGPKASTDSYGFPNLSISAANRTSIAKFYYKLDIEIRLIQKVDNTKAKIAVKMVLTPFKNSSVIPMDKIDVEVESEVLANDLFLEGFTANADEIKEGTLLWAVDRAADKLTKIMVQK